MEAYRVTSWLAGFETANRKLVGRSAGEVEIDKRHVMFIVDFAAKGRNVGLSCPFVPDLHELQCVESLPLGQMLWRRRWQFAAVVGTTCVSRTGVRRAVEQEDDALDLVKFYEVRALGAHLHSAE